MNDLFPEDWPAFRRELVIETAVCFSDMLASDTNPRWDEMGADRQRTLVHNLAVIFQAQDNALQRLSERGSLL